MFLLIGCKKNEDNINCYELTSFDNWTTIDFKTNYTIQVPNEFVGCGLEGFEGRTFNKFSADTKIQLRSGYCNSLFCNDFGDSISSSVPKSIQVLDNSSKTITLNQIEYFCQNSKKIGILYYSESDTSRGRLYWKDNGTLKDALEIYFSLAKLDTINMIIETIKRK